MKLYIGPCGLGLGHITRCERIAREFAERGDDIMFSSYLDGLDYLRRTGLRHFSASPISFRTREDGTIDPKLTATQNGVTVGLWKFIKQLVEEVEQIVRFKPDVVVSDTRVSTLLAGKLLGKPTCLILNQYSVQMPNYPDSERFVDRLMLLFAKMIWGYASPLLGLAWGTSDVIIVPDLPPPYTISTYNLSIPSHITRKVRLMGPVSRNKNPFPNRYGNRSETSGISIFASVSGPATERGYLVRTLSQLLRKLPSNWTLVLSCGDPNGSSVPRVEGDLTVFDWMDEKTYDQAFREADVIISRAGHETIMMAIASGKPLVVIPPPNHTEQANNARRVVELGIGVAVPQGSLNIGLLLAAITESLRKCSERTKELSRLVSGQAGARGVVETVYSLARPSGTTGAV